MELVKANFSVCSSSNFQKILRDTVKQFPSQAGKGLRIKYLDPKMIDLPKEAAVPVPQIPENEIIEMNARPILQPQEYITNEHFEIENLQSQNTSEATSPMANSPINETAGTTNIVKKKKKHWSLQDDMKLINAVNEYKGKNWNKIAECVVGRSNKQCRERWATMLNPDLNKKSWTIEEDQVIICGHEQYGKKWAKIGQLLGTNRSQNAIKNRYYFLIRREEKIKKFIAQDKDEDITQAIDVKKWIESHSKDEKKVFENVSLIEEYMDSSFDALFEELSY